MEGNLEIGFGQVGFGETGFLGVSIWGGGRVLGLQLDSHEVPVWGIFLTGEFWVFFFWK